VSIVGLPTSGKILTVALSGVLVLLWFTFCRIHYIPNPLNPVLWPLSQAERVEFMDCYFEMRKRKGAEPVPQQPGDLEDELRDCLVTNKGWSEVNARRSLARLAGLRRK
jgi:hypothetical protein